MSENAPKPYFETYSEMASYIENNRFLDYDNYGVLQTIVNELCRLDEEEVEPGFTTIRRKFFSDDGSERVLTVINPSEVYDDDDDL